MHGLILNTSQSRPRHSQDLRSSCSHSSPTTLLPAVMHVLLTMHADVPSWLSFQCCCCCCQAPDPSSALASAAEAEARMAELEVKVGEHHRAFGLAPCFPTPDMSPATPHPALHCLVLCPCLPIRATSFGCPLCLLLHPPPPRCASCQISCISAPVHNALPYLPSLSPPTPCTPLPFLSRCASCRWSWASTRRRAGPSRTRTSHCASRWGA